MLACPRAGGSAARGAFDDVSKPSGIASAAAAGLGVVSADFDEDGWQDVYVANDAYPNLLWRNEKDGTFVDEALMRGAAVTLNGQPRAGMGVEGPDSPRSSEPPSPWPSIEAIASRTGGDAATRDRSVPSRGLRPGAEWAVVNR